MSDALDPAGLEHWLASRWAAPLRVAVARAGLDPSELTAAERTRYASLPTELRRRTWLLGRAALKPLLTTIGMDADTAALRFPHPRLTLSHSAGVAIALGSSSADVAGLGVDLELRRPPRRESARFFLAPAELDWLASDPHNASRLLRLWTIKEALYKACDDNSSTSFRDFVLADVEADSGIAKLTDAERRREFEYTSRQVETGYLAAALARSGT